MNLLDSFKSYALSILFIVALGYIGLQHYQFTRLEHRHEVCKNDLLAVEIGSQNRIKQVAIAEQDAAVAHAESVKRGNATLNADAGKTCDANMAWMITHKPI